MKLREMTVPGEDKLFPIVDVPGPVPVFAGQGLVTEESRGGVQVELGGNGSTTAWTRALFGRSGAELDSLVASLGQPAYRARQLEEALYRQWVSSLEEVSTLPRALRESLDAAGFQVGLPQIVETFRSVDGTERYLIAGLDGQTVETVWMPGGDGGDGGEVTDLEALAEGALEEMGRAGGPALAASEAPGLLDRPDRVTRQPGGSRASLPAQRRATICVSSQIGCAVNCQFCLTAKLGILRNLSAGEIAGQVVAVLKRQGVHLGRDRINLVFMGMGEPFLNYDAFLAAMHLLTDSVGLAASRMTVSTSGIVPGILRFAQEPVRCKLAISLNASNDQVREQIMPITRKWDIEAVLDAVRTIPLGPRERITFEYVLLGGVNDRLEHADEVMRLVRTAGFACYVNLIVWNPGPGTGFAQPEQDAVDEFQHRLISQGVTAYIRRPRGRDIYAACGQLKRTTS